MAPRAARAFTLLEMMVVIALIAILAGVMTVSSRPDPHRELVIQAQRIGLLMGVASDEARMRQQAIVWEADLHGYRFVSELPDGERQTFPGDDMLRERAWQAPLTRLAVTDLASGTTRTLVNSEAPPLRVPTAREWVQPRWRLEMANDFGTVALEFDANGHAGSVQ
jgi:general secretion pathway protein H